MVSTRSASRGVELPDDAILSPSKAVAKASPSSPSKRRVANSSAGGAGWAHVPSPWTIFWLIVSLPLVAWDTGYVLLRPLSMPGGRFHWPLWVPYKLYGEVDHIYGWKAFNAGNGFTAAQGFLNLIETLMYLYYAWICYSRGIIVPAPTATADAAPISTRRVEGRAGAVALLVGFSAAVMTLSKTVLYWMNEYYSGFDNIGHNPARDLVILWIIPNGAWLVGSTYMILSMGSDIVDGLSLASKLGKTE